MQKLLTEHDYTVIQPLVELGDEDMVQSLIEVYPFVDGNVQDAIAEIVGQLGTADHLPTLEAWLQNAENRLNGRVVEAVINLNHPRTIKTLSYILHFYDDDFEFMRVFQALKRLGVDLEGLDVPYDKHFLHDQQRSLPPLPNGRRPSVRFRGPNPALRDYIESYICRAKSANAAGKAERGLKLELKVAEQDRIVGQPLPLQAVLTNVGRQDARILCGQDLWESGLETTLIEFLAIGPDHRRFRLVPPCLFYKLHPNPAPLIQDVKTGRTCNPVAADSLTGSATTHFVPNIPGAYRLKVIYDTRNEKIAKSIPGDVTRVHLESPWLEIRVAPSDPPRPFPKEGQQDWPDGLAQQVVEAYFADRWRNREGEAPVAEQIALAINCLRADSGKYGGSVYDSNIGTELAKQARSFLEDHLCEAVPQLLQFIEQYPYVSFVEHDPSVEIYDLIAKSGDRRAVTTLTKRMLDDLDGGRQYQYRWHDDALANALARIGDEDLIRLLMQSFPLESYDVQLFILTLLKQTALDFGRLEIGESEREVWERLLKQSRTFERLAIRFPDANRELRKLIEPRIARLKELAQKGVSEAGLKLMLTVEPEFIELGEEFRIQALIINTSNAPLKVMRSRDGSDVGWVMPVLRASIRGPDHLPRARGGGGRCGNTDRDASNDVFTIGPGQSFDLLGRDTFHYIFDRFNPSELGKHRFQLTYWTKGRAAGSVDDSGELPAGVAPVNLVSNMAELEVVSHDEALRRLGGETRRHRDRTAAEWIVEAGGWVKVRINRHTSQPIKTKNDLPAGPFCLTDAVLKDCNVTDADLTRFDRLSELRNLELTNTQITQFGLALPELRVLALANTNLRDIDLSGLVNDRGVSNLEYLGLLGTPIRSVHLRDFPYLGIINLSGLALDKVELQNLPRLQSIYLFDTTIRSSVIRQIRESFPSIKLIGMDTKETHEGDRDMVQGASLED